MGSIFETLITNPLGVILSTIYAFTSSYGISIILFTVIIKVILLPLAVKQQKSLIQQRKMQPLISELQKKYKNDKEKLNEEMLKLYQEQRFNPAAGCLPMFIQLPIIFGLYRVIYRPLTFIKRMSIDEIKQLGASFNPPIDFKNEIEIAKQSVSINLNFLGLNLADSPHLNKMSILWIIPILAALTTYLSSHLTTKATKLDTKEKNKNDSGEQMQESMMKVFPIMTGFICFQLPAGVGLYWIVSNTIQMIQQLLLNKYFGPTEKEGTIS